MMGGTILLGIIGFVLAVFLVGVRYDKKGPRFIALMVIFGPVTGWVALFYECGLFMEFAAKNIYYALFYNRTYKEELARRDELVSKLKDGA